MKRQRGLVALELALVLPFMLIMLTAVVFYGRLTYHYEVVNKAARDGARYLSSVAALNLKNPALAAQETSLVLTLVQTELAALGASQSLVFVYCDNVPCGALSTAPVEVSVTVITQMPLLYSGYLPELSAQQLVVNSRARYVGN
jgi:Flp pilus assembly protein TadG